MKVENYICPPISILTVTRRATTIRRCVSSVEKQDYNGYIEHIILVDGTPDVFSAWKNTSTSVSNSIELINRSEEDRNGPKRLSYLRNLAVDRAQHERIIFLDDDNGWLENHLSSLWNAIKQSGKYMAHSHRQMLEFDGSPYLREEFPWKRELEERKRVYRLHTELGIMTPGSNIIKDRVGMHDSCVDLGEWLLIRDFVSSHPFESSYSGSDWEKIIVEDAKLSSAIINENVPVACTHLPTLLYYLGGYSNNLSEQASIYWQPPNCAKN